MAAASPDVLVPRSREDAVSAFGEGDGVTVIGGGTIVMPALVHGRLRPARALLLTRAGLDAIEREGATWRIGATASVAALAEEGPEPLASAARGVADLEVRAQATLAGNLCAPPGAESPRGDLQAPLIALDARVRSAGSGGERVESVEGFLANGTAGRLVLEIELEEPEAAGYASLGRPHAHAYTVLSVACARSGGGVRVAVGGAGPHGARCPSVESALARGEDVAAASEAALADLEHLLADDALASAWYRKRMLPVLTARALAARGEGGSR